MGIDTVPAGFDQSNIIDKRKLSDQASNYIQKKIINNELKSGERIVETRIARQLGISQTPVREALRELETMGIVEIRPYLGCFVRAVTRRDLSQVYHLRAMLESYAVSEAIRNAKDIDVSSLIAIHKEMQNAADASDKNRFSLYDTEFHRTIVSAAQNPTLEKMWRMVSVAQWTALTVESTHKPIHFFAELHSHIIEAFSSGNIEQVHQELARHFDVCLDLVSVALFKSKDEEA